MANRYLIDALEVRGSRICVQAHPGFRSKFLADDFWVEYDREVQLSAMDESMLAIPFVLNVAPLIWISGETYRIPKLDERLAEALKAVRNGYRNLYPDIAWDGELLPDAVDVPSAASESTTAALLFSGGVDSVYSSLAHRDAVKYQITIQSLLGRWNWQSEEARVAAGDYFRGFATRFGCESRFITSNLRTFISEARLVGLWPNPRRWMIDVQHGLGFVGLCAPLTGFLGIGRLLMAGCERDHYGLPGGSHPDILNAVRWAGVEICLDGVDRTRQEKLRAIAAGLGDGASPLELRPCLRPAPGFANCGACEKCLQTILGLVGERCDPRCFGFSTSLPTALSTLRKQVLAGRLPMPDPGELLQWQDIQRTVRKRCVEGGGIGLPGPDKPADLDWFGDLDLEEYFRHCHRGPRHAARVLRRRLSLFLDRWPSLSRAVRRALRRLQRRSRSPRSRKNA